MVTESQAHSADYVLISVPISILQKNQILFSPSLPEWKTNSFSKMQMGVFNKVIMEFSEKFWSDNSCFQHYNTELKNSFGNLVNYHHYTGKLILIAMSVGKSDMRVEKNDIESIKKNISTIFS